MQIEPSKTKRTVINAKRTVETKRTVTNAKRTVETKRTVTNAKLTVLNTINDQSLMQSKIEKVPKCIQGEQSRKDTASSRKRTV